MKKIYEKLALRSYLRALLLREDCFYSQKTPIVLLVEKLLSRIPSVQSRLLGIKPFGWGDTLNVGHAVSNASANAYMELEKIPKLWEAFSGNDIASFGINMPLLFKKYIFVELLYRKYFFYELCIQLATEAEGAHISVVVDKSFIGPYAEALTKSVENVEYRTEFLAVEALAAVLALPFLLPVFWRKKTSANGPIFNNAIICSVDNPAMAKGYSDLFSSDLTISYVVSPEYFGSFQTNENSTGNVFPLYLSVSAYNQLKAIQQAYFRTLQKHIREFSSYGIHLLKFFNNLIQGRLKAPDGSGNYVFACEHHDLSKTIRNEFIRSQGSKSILFPYSSLYVLQHYADEYYENYDYVCSPGKHYEDTLIQNKSLPTTQLRTGTYAIQKYGAGRNSGAITGKISAIRSFIGDNIAITILCPGVCKPTYHSEAKLMELAKQLAACEGVKVIIRQKPFVQEECYSDFYTQYTNNNSSMLLTGMEYELFDFLPVTNLFITSYSTSACELAVCGANILFVDFLQQDDRFIFWQPEIAGKLLLKEDEALTEIVKLLRDGDDGEIRQRYRADLSRFVEYIGYSFDDYEAYRENLLSLLSKHVFPANWKQIN